MNLEKDFLSDKSDEALLEELRRVAKLIGKGTVTKDEFEKHGRVSAETIARRFGGWNAALTIVGLEISLPTRMSRSFRRLAEFGVLSVEDQSMMSLRRWLPTARRL